MRPGAGAIQDRRVTQISKSEDTKFRQRCLSTVSRRQLSEANREITSERVPQITCRREIESQTDSVDTLGERYGQTDTDGRKIPRNETDKPAGQSQDPSSLPHTFLSAHLFSRTSPALLAGAQTQAPGGQAPHLPWPQRSCPATCPPSLAWWGLAEGQD